MILETLPCEMVQLVITTPLKSSALGYTLYNTLDLTPHDKEHIEIDQHALDNIASNRDLSGTPAPQLAEKDRQTLYEDVALRLFITGKFE